MSSYSDLVTFFDQTGLHVDAQNCAMGIDMNHRSELKRHAAIRPDDSLPADLNIALQVYLADPTLLDKYREIKGSHVFQFIWNQGFSITLKEFGLLFGREQSSGYRWVTLGRPARQPIQRAWAAIMESATPADLISSLAEAAGISISRFPAANDTGVTNCEAA